jgi:hemerythrin-like domain-containing protein
MHEAVRIIEDEHRSIAAVLHGLIHLTRRVRDHGEKPDFAVLHAMLDYIVSFPEKLHHPKEDRYLFAAVRTRNPQAAALLDSLEAEHAFGGTLIRRLMESLVAYETSGKFDEFARAVESYSDFHWAHMQREEEEVLPLAKKTLTESDWESMAKAFKENDDPLFGIKPKQEFEQLFRRVVQLAPAPIGIGPSSVA